MCIRDRDWIEKMLPYINEDTTSWQLRMISLFDQDPEDLVAMLEAVSYTHLDVYKRQVLQNGMTRTLQINAWPILSIRKITAFFPNT